MAKLTPQGFRNFFTYYQGEENQKQGVEVLYRLIQQRQPDLLEEDSVWVTHYRAKPEVTVSNPLPVKYMSQLDNGPEGWRQCQTSSIAMCLDFLGVCDPLSGKPIDDDLKYRPFVVRHGDTTSAAAHQAALTELGVRHRFRTDMHKEDLMREIDKGYPVAIGVLHHGHVSAPKGGGHYLVLRGYDDTHALVHDPYGSIDLVNGGWSSQGIGTGKGEKYSWKNLLPRWDVGGGWGWTFS